MIKTILIIVVSVSILGLLIFVFVRNALKKKIDALFVWDLESNLARLGNLIQYLNSKSNIAIKFKPSSQIDEKKLLIFFKENNILYFQNKSFSDIWVDETSNFSIEGKAVGIIREDL